MGREGYGGGKELFVIQNLGRYQWSMVVVSLSKWTALQWSSQSPDLNLTEHASHLLKTKLRRAVVNYMSVFALNSLMMFLFL